MLREKRVDRRLEPQNQKRQAGDVRGPPGSKVFHAAECPADRGAEIRGNKSAAS